LRLFSDFSSARALTEALDGEWAADGIRCLVVPSFIDTPLLDTGADSKPRDGDGGQGLLTGLKVASGVGRGCTVHTLVGKTAHRMAFARGGCQQLAQADATTLREPPVTPRWHSAQRARHASPRSRRRFGHRCRARDEASASCVVSRIFHAVPRVVLPFGMILASAFSCDLRHGSGCLDEIGEHDRPRDRVARIVIVPLVRAIEGLGPFRSALRSSGSPCRAGAPTTWLRS
jgi:hypothetical protein